MDWPTFPCHKHQMKVAVCNLHFADNLLLQEPGTLASILLPACGFWDLIFDLVWEIEGTLHIPSGLNTWVLQFAVH